MRWVPRVGRSNSLWGPLLAVCYWHKADIDFDAQHVCFRAVKRTSRIGWPMSANDPFRTLGEDRKRCLGLWCMSRQVRTNARAFRQPSTRIFTKMKCLGQGHEAMAIMRMTASMYSVCKAGCKTNRGCQRCVGRVIRSIGTGNTIVELRSLAMSNNVAR
jgi:hypothetical protein